MTTSGAGILAAGQQVGSFTIERELGRAGVGREYGARAADGAAVRIRIVDPERAADPGLVGRFEREARIARGIEHPNLVSVLETGVHEGIPFLVQRSGGESTLADRLVAGRLELGELTPICRQVAAALDALHEAGVVHRDVCPANIQLDGGTAHLAGLGLVKDNQGTALTEAGQALGSVDYMAPEQVRGEPVTPATDVYALGCVAYEALAGAPPFGDRAGMRALWAHLQDAPPMLAESRPELGRDVSDAIGRALLKQPGDRPRSAGQFARILELATELSRS